MKNAALALLFTFPFVTATAQNGWNVLTTGTTLNLLDVQAFAADTVFMAGDDGILLSSDNGGGTFTTYQQPSQLIYTAVHFRTADTGFVANGSGTIRRTTDGGQTFSNAGSCTCYINSVSFTDAHTGLFSGITGVYRSTDGGVSFGSTPVNTGPAFAGISSPAPGIFMGLKNGTIYRSTDYGQTFSADTIHTATSFPLIGIRFFNALQGYAMTADGYQYYSGDQGGTWMQVNNAPLTNVQRMTFMDSLTGYLIEGPQRNHIYKTVNGGQNWNLDYTSTSAMDDIDANNYVVYACGQNGLAIKNDSYTAVPEPTAAAGVILFPNPATGEQFLEFSAGRAGQPYTISNMQGQVLVQGALEGKKTRMPVNLLPAGVYVVQVSGGTPCTLRLVKQ